MKGKTTWRPTKVAPWQKKVVGHKTNNGENAKTVLFVGSLLFCLSLFLLKEKVTNTENYR
jgi:hypothetical protein